MELYGNVVELGNIVHADTVAYHAKIGGVGASSHLFERSYVTGIRIKPQVKSNEASERLKGFNVYEGVKLFCKSTRKPTKITSSKRP